MDNILLLESVSAAFHDGNAFCKYLLECRCKCVASRVACFIRSMMYEGMKEDSIKKSPKKPFVYLLSLQRQEKPRDALRLAK